MNENETFEMTEENSQLVQNEYANLTDRYKAIVFDVGIMIMSLMFFSYVFSYFEVESDNLRMYLFFFIFIFYEPVFTSLFGSTIGQGMFNITVRKESDETNKISLPLALWRYVFKAALGVISLLTVGSHPKRKAIHDQVAGTVVIYKKKNP